jgi:hypothetical protein
LDRVFNCKDVLAFRVTKLEIRHVHSGCSPVKATVYFSSRPACEGTSQRLLLPLRITFDFAAISKPLISLGSMLIASLSRGLLLSGYITIEYTNSLAKSVLDSNIFEFVYCLAWLNKLEKLLSIFASVASMNGFLVTLILKLSRVSVQSAKVLTGINRDETQRRLNA